MNYAKIDADGDFVRAKPESQGIASGAIVRLIDGIKEANYDIHSLHIFRNGYLVAGGCAKPYEERGLRRIYSTAKSVSSLAILLAAQEGLLKLDDAIINYFPDMLPDVVSDDLASLKLFDLLIMSTGMKEDGLEKYLLSNGQIEMARSFFSYEIVHKPGTEFFYNNAVPEMLGMVIQRLTGQTYVEYLTPRVLKPLGATFTVQQTPQGWLDGSTTVSTAHDLAKFSLLYLQNGFWEGKQLISPELIKLATTKHISTTGATKLDPMFHKKDECGYGMQLWMNQYGGFRLVGAFGNIGMVIPEENLAIVYTGMETRDIDWLINDTVLKNMKQGPIPENGSAKADHLSMERRFSRWSTAPEGAASNPSIEKRYDGKLFNVESNVHGITGISFGFSDKSLIVEQGKHRTVLLYGVDGDFAENPGSIKKTHKPQTVFGADPELSYISACWIGNKFLFEIRHAADMLTEFIEADFGEDKISMFSENTFERLRIFHGFGESSESTDGLDDTIYKAHRTYQCFLNADSR